MKLMASHLGELKEVLNTNKPTFSRAAGKYYSVWVEVHRQGEDPDRVALLLTHNDLVNLRERAIVNDEDIPALIPRRRGFFTWFKDLW